MRTEILGCLKDGPKTGSMIAASLGYESAAVTRNILPLLQRGEIVYLDGKGYGLPKVEASKVAPKKVAPTGRIAMDDLADLLANCVNKEVSRSWLDCQYGRIFAMVLDMLQIWTDERRACIPKARIVTSILGERGWKKAGNKYVKKATSVSCCSTTRRIGTMQRALFCSESEAWRMVLERTLTECEDRDIMEICREVLFQPSKSPKQQRVSA